MEEQLFELLKIRMRRNSRLAGDIAGISGDDSAAIKDAFCAVDQLIRKVEHDRKNYEEARSQLAEIAALQEKIRRSLRWKIDNWLHSRIISVFLPGRGKTNAFSRLDELATTIKETLEKNEKTVEPLRFAQWNCHFAGSVDFGRAPEIIVGKVAIIVLNRNGEDHLGHMFSSFAKFNTYPGIEFIIVDHDSDDKSLDIIAKYSESIPVRLISFDRNFTFSYSNNFAAGLTDAEYLFILNNDIIFDQDVIGGLVRVFKEMPDAGIVAPCLYFPDDQLNRSGNIQHSGIDFYYRNKRNEHLRKADTDPPSYHILNYKYSHLFRDTIVPVNSTEEVSGRISRPAICAAAMMCKRDDFLKAGGFDENYIYGYEDVDLSLVFRQKLGKELIIDGSLGMIHNESYTRKKEGLYKSTLKIFNLLMLTYRFGYFLRIQYLRDLFSGSRQFTVQRPVVVVIARRPGELHQKKDRKTEFLTQLFTDHLDWRLNFTGFDEAGTVLLEADLAVVLENDMPSSILDRAKETIMVIRWAGEGNTDFPFETLYKDFYPGQTGAVYPEPDPVREYLLDQISHSLRIAVKLPDAFENEDKRGTALMKKISSLCTDNRCTLRADQHSKWYEHGTLTDNAVISFAETIRYIPQPGQINVLWVMPGKSLQEVPYLEFYDLIISEDGLIDTEIQRISRIRCVKPEEMMEAIRLTHERKLSTFKR